MPRFCVSFTVIDLFWSGRISVWRVIGRCSRQKQTTLDCSFAIDVGLWSPSAAHVTGATGIAARLAPQKPEGNPTGQQTAVIRRRLAGGSFTPPVRLGIAGEKEAGYLGVRTE
jgi:hypothetical protein